MLCALGVLFMCGEGGGREMVSACFVLWLIYSSQVSKSMFHVKEILCLLKSP